MLVNFLRDGPNLSTRSIRSFDNLLFKFDVSLPLVTGELLEKTVDVINIYVVTLLPNVTLRMLHTCIKMHATLLTSTVF